MPNQPVGMQKGGLGEEVQIVELALQFVHKILSSRGGIVSLKLLHGWSAFGKSRFDFFAAFYGESGR